MAGLITDVHILPMFPYTSDDGFAVTDYTTIDPHLGDWQDIATLRRHYRLMFDFVANHVSASHPWFQQFLANVPAFRHAFIEATPEFDVSHVTRPRTTPLFHEFSDASGAARKVWTTFSRDQIDVNVQDPQMLVRLTQVLLDFAQRGAASIRLDAIGFLWKTSGTTCMHQPETHEIVRLWHTLLQRYAPHTQIITETNVPYLENISYFGHGDDEADQVYQFPLPPLLLHTFLSGDATVFKDWAKTLTLPSDRATYFNFLASHDGIGMRPVETLLTDAQREALAANTLAQGGRVSYKTNPDGSRSVYELNINYGDALRQPGDSDSLAAQRLIAAHHIQLSLVGVPAIYYHSLFGSRGDQAAVARTGDNRQINRERLQAEPLLAAIRQPGFRQRVFDGLTQLIRIRQQEPAFSPYGTQTVQPSPAAVVRLERTAAGAAPIVCLTNITATPQTVDVPTGRELIQDRAVTGTLTLPPYGCAWVKVDHH
nr:alpha-amylase family glycosyl hydrolase [Lacticaseibacillus absianus]